jgi:signal transduction histidine kinase
VSRIQCYIRARLHRRIFLWFGTAILIAGLVAYGVVGLLGGSQMRREFEGIRAFVSHRFAEAWSDPAERHELAVELHRDLDVDVTVRGDSGASLDVVGDACTERNIYSLPIERDGRTLGAVEICSELHARRQVSAIAAVLAACSVLWLLSALVTRKVASSLAELERAAREIGLGRYDTDIRLHKHAPGEFLLLAEAMRDMASKIKEQMSEQRELLASVSHEIRSPLARIRLLLELSRPARPSSADDEVDAHGDPDQPLRDKAFADMEREIEEIDELVGGLLASSRVDFSALTLRSLDVREAVELALERAGAEAKIEIVGSPSSVSADATLLARALANLLENAAKHGEGADRVRLTFTEPETGDDPRPQKVKIEVLDRGKGFEEGEETKVFQSFYRRPSKAHESLGLGLALVRRIAEAHGGAAFARNREGGGAVVGFDLPVLGTRTLD